MAAQAAGPGSSPQDEGFLTRPDDTESRPASPEIIVLTLIAVVIGVVTRFVTASSLWLDEALSVNIASLPLSEIPKALERDGHPPLFYVLLHFWTDLFGTGDVAVRAMSGLFGLLALPLIWVIGRRRGGPLLAWLALAVFAIEPFAVRYSDEARMYSLVMLLVLCGYVLLDDVLRRDRATWWRYLLLAVDAAALLYTHYWSMWLLTAVGIVLVWTAWRSDDRDRRRVVIITLVALAIGAVLFVPWLPTMLSQSKHTGTPWAPPMRPTSALSVTLADLGGWGYGEQTLAAVVVALLLVLGVFGRARTRSLTELDLRTRRQLRAEALIAALALAIGVGISYVLKGAYASRYASIVLPLIVLLMAGGLTRFRARWVTFGVAAVCCLLLAVGAFWNTRDNRSQMGQIGAKVTQQAKSGDVVVFCPDQLGPAGTRAMPGDASGIVYLSYPSLGDPRFVDWVDYKQRNDAADPAAIGAEIQRRAGDHAIFLVENGAYRTFENDCESLMAALAVGRTGEQLDADDGEHFFEHAALWRFTKS